MRGRRRIWCALRSAVTEEGARSEPTQWRPPAPPRATPQDGREAARWHRRPTCTQQDRCRQAGGNPRCFRGASHDRSPPFAAGGRLTQGGTARLSRRPVWRGCGRGRVRTSGLGPTLRSTPWQGQGSRIPARRSALLVPAKHSAGGNDSNYPDSLVSSPFTTLDLAGPDIPRFVRASPGVQGPVCFGRRGLFS
jgi:hypothetical protein